MECKGELPFVFNLRPGQPNSNASENLAVINVSVVEAWGINQDDPSMRIRKEIMVNLSSVRFEIVANRCFLFSKESIYEL